MEKDFTPRDKIEIAPEKTMENPMNGIEQHMHVDALASESYEDVTMALSDVEAQQEFRKKTSQMPFASFHEMIEGATILDKLPLGREEKDKKKQAMVATMSERSQRFSPRVADLYQALLCEIAGETYHPHFEITGEKMTELKKDGDLAVLFSAEVPWDLKLNRIETRLVSGSGLIGYLPGVRSIDKREGNEMTDDVRKWREEQLKHAPARPHQRRNESQPGVDPMERLKKGERAPSIWTIQSAYDGYCKYYKEQTFSKWDNVRNVWFEDLYTYEPIESIPLSDIDQKKGHIDLTMETKTPTNQWISLGVTYTHDLHTIKAGGRKYQAQKDQNGDLLILVEGKDREEIVLNVVLTPNLGKKLISREPEKIRVPNMLAEFSAETNKKLKEIVSEKRGNIPQAKAIAQYVVSRILYLAPKDRVEAEYYNNIYRTSPKGFAGAVDEVKKADCDVENTYFAALCSKLNIPVRHCVGHSVVEDENGFLIINSGTGHGWSEVWDEVNKKWIVIDATSAGDPNLEEQEQGSNNNRHVCGNFGGQMAVCPSEEQLEALCQKLAQHKEELSYTKEERQLAEAAGVDLQEARQIVREIHEAENTRLPNGELVIDALSKVFNLLIVSRKSLASSYDGPVRESEGGEEIMDVVHHYMYAKSGETDPASRELPTEEIKEEKLIGGFEVYLICDKSGSMGSEAEGELLWKMQRRAAYLIFASLHQFERDLERSGIQQENALLVKTQGISFRGSQSDEIDIDKQLSPKFTDLDKVKMWNSLTTQGSGNGDVAALSHIYSQIQKEIASVEERGEKDHKLRIVLACSDGAPDDPVKVNDLVLQLGQLGVVVVGIGLTDTATAVPIIYDTPYSRGDIARNINDLPAIAAKHIVGEAIKLFPEKAKANAKEIIEKYFPVEKDVVK